MQNQDKDEALILTDVEKNIIGINEVIVSQIKNTSNLKRLGALDINYQQHLNLDNIDKEVLNSSSEIEKAFFNYFSENQPSLSFAEQLQKALQKKGIKIDLKDENIKPYIESIQEDLNNLEDKSVKGYKDFFDGPDSEFKHESVGIKKGFVLRKYAENLLNSISLITLSRLGFLDLANITTIEESINTQYKRLKTIASFKTYQNGDVDLSNDRTPFKSYEATEKIFGETLNRAGVSKFNSKVFDAKNKIQSHKLALEEITKEEKNQRNKSLLNGDFITKSFDADLYVRELQNFIKNLAKSFHLQAAKDEIESAAQYIKMQQQILQDLSDTNFEYQDYLQKLKEKIEKAEKGLNSATKILAQQKMNSIESIDSEDIFQFLDALADIRELKVYTKTYMDSQLYDIRQRLQMPLSFYLFQKTLSDKPPQILLQGNNIYIQCDKIEKSIISMQIDLSKQDVDQRLYQENIKEGDMQKFIDILANIKKLDYAKIDMNNRITNYKAKIESQQQVLKRLANENSQFNDLLIKVENGLNNAPEYINENQSCQFLELVNDMTNLNKHIDCLFKPANETLESVLNKYVEITTKIIATIPSANKNLLNQQVTQTKQNFDKIFQENKCQALKFEQLQKQLIGDLNQTRSSLPEFKSTATLSKILNKTIDFVISLFSFSMDKMKHSLKELKNCFLSLEDKMNNKLIEVINEKKSDVESSWIDKKKHLKAQFNHLASR